MYLQCVSPVIPSSDHSPVSSSPLCLLFSPASNQTIILANSDENVSSSCHQSCQAYAVVSQRTPGPAILLLPSPESISTPEPGIKTMQIDNTGLAPAKQQRRLTKGLCRYCGADGHVISACSVRPLLPVNTNHAHLHLICTLIKPAIDAHTSSQLIVLSHFHKVDYLPVLYSSDSLQVTKPSYLPTETRCSTTSVNGARASTGSAYVRWKYLPSGWIITGFNLGSFEQLLRFLSSMCQSLWPGSHPALTRSEPEDQRSEIKAFVGSRCTIATNIPPGAP
ncbi:hypothetical protein DPX16_22530 [Anabarilius grahami]|uniref:Uncharacterized protein n=1 Tax=Anabarilius grahami TaxID=495550 RepID=A0A3N0YZY3_ANAGA|nr:hypothetical protein DPX16_22530 [Anabarilius grahami]